MTKPFSTLATLIFLSVLLPNVFAFEKASKKQIITLPLSKIIPKVDGMLDAKAYDDAVILSGSFKGWGASPRPQSPTIYLKRSKDRLFVLYDNPLKDGERPTLRGAIPDNSGIAMGNAVELFFLPHLPDGELLQYIQFIGNARNCVYDALSRPEVGVTYVAEFTKPWLFANQVIPGHWYSEISTTFKDINIIKTTDGEYFDMDMGRDGGTGPNGVHSYTMAYHTIQNGNAVKIVFDATAPAAQWLSFGDFENNRFTPHLKLKGMGKAGTYSVHLKIADSKLQKDKTRKVLFEKKTKVKLPANGLVEVKIDHVLAKNAKGIAYYEITKADGSILFYRELPFTTNLTAKPLYPKAEAKPLLASAKMAPSYGKIGVTADIIDYQGNKSDVTVEVTAYREGSKKVLGKTILRKFSLDFASGILDVGKLTAGQYTVKFNMINQKTGKSLGQKEDIKLTRKVYEWENNKLGYSDTPPEPWVPIKVKGDTVEVIGRTYTFTGLGLPKTIATYQQNPTRGPGTRDVLAEPVSINAIVNNKAVSWTYGKSKIISHNKNEAVIVGSADSSVLKAEVRGTLEFDGFYKINLKLTPKTKVAFDSITVEMPLPDKYANLFHSVGESMRTNKTFADFAGKGDGVLWDSKSAAKNGVIKGNFLPIAWLGDEDRGLSWMCDNDRSWQITFDKPSLDVIRRDGKTIFRMHLLNKKGVLTNAIDTVFSLQATPVRPRPKGGSWKTIEWYGWGHFDEAVITSKSFDAYREGKLPSNGPWYRTKQAKEENRWWKYACMSSDRIDKADPLYGQMIKDFSAEWYCDSIWMKMQNKAHQDFELWAYQKWHDEASMDGLYFDNTFPGPSINLLNNTAYIDDTNQLRPGYTVMSYREQMKRLRILFLSWGAAPVLKAHITDTPNPGYLGFCDFWMDGENGGYPNKNMKNPDFVDRWVNPTGLTNMRISMGQQWGTIPQYLYSWGIEPTHAVLGMFDLENKYMSMGWKPYHEFGRYEKDVKYIPYWSEDFPATVIKNADNVYLTLWKRSGRVRILISNFDDKAKEIDVKLDLKKLGLTGDLIAVDEREGSQQAFTTDSIRNIYVGRHNYQYIIVASPDTYKPLAPDYDKAILPPKKKWIQSLCDDFTKLDLDRWKTFTSPYIELATVDRSVSSPAFSIQSGKLKIRTSQAICANVSMPFNQDNCSVQVEIREPAAFQPPTFIPGLYSYNYGPSLNLIWPNGNSLHFSAFEVGPAHTQKRFHCRAIVDGKVILNKHGDKPSTLNYLKIVQQADEIEFYSSNDSKNWSLLATLNRKHFKGAASTLMLGHGMTTDGTRPKYSYDSFFDKLITFRNQ
ncbi:MAG: hypothetical protein HRT89_12745 [Lentisphaeria bacterium]|nr:DUF6067 family protein [Lentisphaeria bacterium]NQZ68926.1 hypothetical protein [Lentisphaeria bacterium]